MRTLSELIDRFKSEFPQELVPLKLFDHNSGQQQILPQPKYLFRGERTALWKTTRSTFSRFKDSGLDFREINYYVTGIHPELGIPYEDNRRSLYFFLKSALFESCPKALLPEQQDLALAIAGLMQHYGFDTSFMDATSDLLAAAAFASVGEPGDRARPW